MPKVVESIVNNAGLDGFEQIYIFDDGARGYVSEKRCIVVKNGRILADTYKGGGVTDQHSDAINMAIEDGSAYNKTRDMQAADIFEWLTVMGPHSAVYVTNGYYTIDNGQLKLNPND